MSDDRARIWIRIGQQSAGAPVTLAHVCAATAVEVDVNGAGLSVMTSAVLRETLHATDQTAANLEELQLTLGQGPCVDAFTGGGPVLAGDLDSVPYLTRWPAFAPAALRLGVRAVFALPLQLGAIRWGAVDLYRTRAGSLDAGELADALTFVEIISGLVLDAAAGGPSELAELVRLDDDPTRYQAQVHQATGMIIVQLGINAEAAFARLRAYAYASDRRLGEVARDVVARRLRLSVDPDEVDS